MLNAEQSFRKMGDGLERGLLELVHGSAGCRWLRCQREAELACHSRHCRKVHLSAALGVYTGREEQLGRPSRGCRGAEGE